MCIQILALELSEGLSTMQCVYCGASQFSLMKLRISDVLRLFLLRLPARCHHCNRPFRCRQAHRDFGSDSQGSSLKIRCVHCRATSLLLSQLRIGDLPRVLLLHYPIRCHDCSSRFYLTFVQALAVRRVSGKDSRRLDACLPHSQS